MSDIERRFIMSDGGHDETEAEYCPHGWFGAHRFEPRYDLGPADVHLFKSISGGGAPAFVEKMRTKVYVRDICTKCGKTIER